MKRGERASLFLHVSRAVNHYNSKDGAFLKLAALPLHMLCVLVCCDYANNHLKEKSTEGGWSHRRTTFNPIVSFSVNIRSPSAQKYIQLVPVSGRGGWTRRRRHMSPICSFCVCGRKFRRDDDDDYLFPVECVFRRLSLHSVRLDRRLKFEIALRDPATGFSSFSTLLSLSFPRRTYFLAAIFDATVATKETSHPSVFFYYCSFFVSILYPMIYSFKGKSPSKKNTPSK